MNCPDCGEFMMIVKKELVMPEMRAEDSEDPIMGQSEAWFLPTWVKVYVVATISLFLLLTIPAFFWFQYQDNQVDALQAEINTLQVELDQLNLDLRDKTISARDLENKIAILQGRLVLLQSGYDDLVSENRTLAIQITNLRIENTQLQLKITQLQSQVSTLQSSLEQLKQVAGSSVYYDSNTLYLGELACTGSMRPTLDCGDIVLRYIPQSLTEIRIGDIITYYIPISTAWSCYFEGQNILHRVIRITWSSEYQTNYFWMKGDNNSSEDDCGIPFGMITSKIIGVVWA